MDFSINEITDIGGLGGAGLIILLSYRLVNIAIKDLCKFSMDAFKLGNRVADIAEKAVDSGVKIKVSLQENEKEES